MVSLSGKGKRERASSKTGERTVLLVDIENGSVAAALMQISAHESPKLFAEARVALPLPQTLRAQKLLQELGKALRSALIHTSTVAARIRANEAVSAMGQVSEAAVFIAPPWSALRDGKKGLEWKFESELISLVRGEIDALWGDLPVSFHPFGSTAGWTAGALFPQQEDFLLCAITGELAELGLVRGGELGAWGTIPTGHHTVVRTLASHGGITHAEAHSALHLSRYGQAPALESLAEPMAAAGEHFAFQFKDAAQEVLGETPVSGILVVALEPVGEWFARSLSNEASLIDLFPNGGSVRALRRSHVMPHLSAHASNPDLILMLEALFINGIY